MKWWSLLGWEAKCLLRERVVKFYTNSNSSEVYIHHHQGVLRAGPLKSWVCQKRAKSGQTMFKFGMHRGHFLWGGSVNHTEQGNCPQHLIRWMYSFVSDSRLLQWIREKLYPLLPLHLMWKSILHTKCALLNKINVTTWFWVPHKRSKALTYAKETIRVQCHTEALKISSSNFISCSKM